MCYPWEKSGSARGRNSWKRWMWQSQWGAECVHLPQIHLLDGSLGWKEFLGEGLDALLPCALLGTSVARVFDGTGAWGNQVAPPLLWDFKCVSEEPFSPVGFFSGQGEGWFGS